MNAIRYFITRLTVCAACVTSSCGPLGPVDSADEEPTEHDGVASSSSALNATGWSDDSLAGDHRTQNRPALATLDGVVYMAYRSAYSDAIWVTTFNGPPDPRNHWHESWVIPGKSTNQAPALVRYGNRLYLFHTQGDALLYASSLDGRTWSASRTFFENSRDEHMDPPAPAAAVVGGYLYVAIQYDVDLCVDDPDWHGPEGCIVGRYGIRLFGFAESSTPGVLSMFWDRQVRSAGADASNMTSTAVALVVYVPEGSSRRQLHLLRATSRGNIVDSPIETPVAVCTAGECDVPPFRWEPIDLVGEVDLGFRTSTGLSAASCGRYVHYVHKAASSNNIMWSHKAASPTSAAFRTDPLWSWEDMVPRQSTRYAPAIGCYNDRPILVHRGAGSSDLDRSRIYFSLFSCGTQTAPCP